MPVLVLIEAVEGHLKLHWLLREHDLKESKQDKFVTIIKKTIPGVRPQHKKSSKPKLNLRDACVYYMDLIKS